MNIQVENLGGYIEHGRVVLQTWLLVAARPVQPTVFSGQVGSSTTSTTHADRAERSLYLRKSR